MADLPYTKPDGTKVWVPEESARDAEAHGYVRESPERAEARQQPLRAAWEGAVRGATFGFAEPLIVDYAEALGKLTDEEAQQQVTLRREENPVASLVGYWSPWTLLLVGLFVRWIRRRPKRPAPVAAGGAGVPAKTRSRERLVWVAIVVVLLSMLWSARDAESTARWRENYLIDENYQLKRERDECRDELDDAESELTRLKRGY